MDQAEFTLSRPVCLSLPIEEADKLLQEKDGRCALVYLALLRAGGKSFPAERIGLTERELRQTMERLCALGLVSAAGKEQPAPAQRRTAPADDRPGAAEPKLVPAAELPQYTAEDISARMLSDGPMQTVRREAEQLYGRKLTTPEMNMLLGLRDYLGLPADVLMELIHYVFQEYRAERGHAGTPTMRRIEKEAYEWADQEIHTTAQAEEFHLLVFTFLGGHFSDLSLKGFTLGLQILGLLFKLRLLGAELRLQLLLGGLGCVAVHGNGLGVEHADFHVGESGTRHQQTSHKSEGQYSEHILLLGCTDTSGNPARRSKWIAFNA